MKFNLRAIVTILITMVDDIILIGAAIWIMSIYGITIPWWLIAIIALAVLGWNWFRYRAVIKNPTLGFENMVGQTGQAVDTIRRSGTVRIGHELWQAGSTEVIEPGTEIRVVDQNGLKLTVVRK